MAQPAYAASADPCITAENAREPCFSDPECSEHVQKSGTFKSMHDDDHALDELKKANSLRPGPILQRTIGGTLLKLKHPQEALEWLRKVDIQLLCRATAENVRKDIATAHLAIAATQPSHSTETLVRQEVPAATLSTPTPEIRHPFHRWKTLVGVLGGLSAIGLAVGLGVGLGLHRSQPIVIDAQPQSVN